MAANIGFSLLLLTFSIAIFLPFFNFFSYKKYAPRDLEKVNFFLMLVIFVSAISSQLCLIYSFVISDYSVSNIYKNSHHLKPLIYKISGSWGNHEGSMLLLISTLCAYGLAFNIFSKIESKQKLIINSTQSFIIALFVAYTAISSNPFERIFPTPISGMELNPLLQDIGLALHPPMLYTGYIGFSLVFSFLIAGLLSEKIDREFIIKLKPFLLFPYAFLTLGIGLGSWWAYRELGWGGYWFWDPVENISLMPWIGATVLIHAAKLVERKETNKNWTAFLAILTFILCLLGIFLTRSGILTSVHSFAIDATRGFAIITLILLIGGSALLIFGAKISKIENAKNIKNTRSDILILINNYFLLVALFIVLLGTIYPILSRGIFDKFISIGANYYNGIFQILIIPFLVFLAAQSIKEKILSRRNILILMASLALTLATFFYPTKVEITQIIILFLAIFTALSNFSLKFNVMRLAHFGFALIICGIVISSTFSLTKELNLKEGESFAFGSYSFNFEEIEHYKGENFIARQGNFMVKKDEEKIGELKPQLRYYPIADQATNEAAIMHKIFGDLYLVIGTKDEKENYAVRAYFKPFIYLIWLGCLVIFFAAIMQAFLSFKKTYPN